MYSDYALNIETKEAYDLFHKGTLALAEMEQQGMRVNRKYIRKTKDKLSIQIESIEEEFKASKFYKRWEHSKKKKVNIYSAPQLGAYLYGVRKIEPPKLTEKGTPSTDEEALSQIGIPALKLLLKAKKLKKMRDTYLDAFLREQVDGVIHPIFNLHLVRTYRGCIAKGTKILTVQDGKNGYKDGTPIEEVKKGDYVYCFSDTLKPVVKKVLWAGKTGNMEVIRVHWSGGQKKGHIDLTPDHRIRMLDGSYVEAQNLIGDFRNEGSKNAPKIRVLSGNRNGEYLNFTNHLKGNKKGILEHRLVFSNLKGKLRRNEVVHHKDGNHQNNEPVNLEKMKKDKHSRLHYHQSSNKTKRKRHNGLRKARKERKYKTGKENPLSLHLSKFTCLRLLAESKGIITKVNYDFASFKRCLNEHKIDHSTIPKRYASNGSYIWKGTIKKNFHLGRNKVRKILGGVGYYTLLDLYDYFGFDSKRKWANQFGEFVAGNHAITKIEKINKKVDVYDLTIEDHHNFIANQICVHNSADSPNIQNIPKRDEELMNIVRRAIYPRRGHQLLELDYGQLEVRIAAAYHNDPTMIKYIETGHDFHLDFCKDLFKIKNYNPEDKTHKKLRSAAKNGFVFPQFYGDWFRPCAANLAINWGELPRKGRWKTGMGIPFEDGNLAEHMVKKGIGSLTKFENHIEKIEKAMWEKKFKVYAEWKDSWYKQYQKYGYCWSKTGFTFQGNMKRNDVINYPVQGAAFHVLLWSLIQGIQALKWEGMKSKIVGQIHDAIVFDIYPPELDRVIAIMKCIMVNDVRHHFKWINVPLEVEAELCGIDKSWATKKDYKIN